MKSHCDSKDTTRSFNCGKFKEETAHAKYLRQFGFTTDDTSPDIPGIATKAYARYLRQFGFMADSSSTSILMYCIRLIRYECNLYQNGKTCTYVTRSRDHWKAHVFKAHGCYACEECMRRYPDYIPKYVYWDFESLLIHQFLKHGGGYALNTAIKVWREWPQQFYWWNEKTMGPWTAMIEDEKADEDDSEDGYMIYA